MTTGSYGDTKKLEKERRGKKSMNVEKIWDDIIELGIATEDELQLITSINGYNIEALNDVIYTRTGYRNIEQYKESEY